MYNRDCNALKPSLNCFIDETVPPVCQIGHVTRYPGYLLCFGEEPPAFALGELFHIRDIPNGARSQHLSRWQRKDLNEVGDTSTGVLRSARVDDRHGLLSSEESPRTSSRFLAVYHLHGANPG